MKRQLFTYAAVFLLASFGLACSQDEGDKGTKNKTKASAAKVEQTAASSPSDASAADLKPSITTAEDEFLPLSDETMRLITMNEQEILQVLDLASVAPISVEEDNPSATASPGISHDANVSISTGPVKVDANHNVTYNQGTGSLNASFSINIEIDRIFQNRLSRHPGVMTPEDARRLAAELCEFVNASVRRDVLSATAHWNKFIRIISDIEARKKSGLAKLFSTFVPKVATFTVGLLNLATELVSSVISFNVNTFKNVADNLVGLVFDLLS